MLLNMDPVTLIATNAPISGLIAGSVSNMNIDKKRVVLPQSIEKIKKHGVKIGIGRVVVSEEHTISPDGYCQGVISGEKLIEGAVHTLIASFIPFGKSIQPETLEIGNAKFNNVLLKAGTQVLYVAKGRVVGKKVCGSVTIFACGEEIGRIEDIKILVN